MSAGPTDNTGLVIFDLDGVLVATPGLHRAALNQALLHHGRPALDEAEQDRLEALPTRSKLAALGITGELAESIWSYKQAMTLALLPEHVAESSELLRLFAALADAGYRTAIASNAVRRTIEETVKLLGLTPDLIVGSDDGVEPKPHPAMYWKCMRELRVPPWDTLIVEDAPRGLEAAHRSGAQVLQVAGPEETTLERVFAALAERRRPQLVMPAAGRGSRFTAAGYTTPKPLIEVHGVAMMLAAFRSLELNLPRPLAIISAAMPAERVEALGFDILVADRVTEGAACTLMLAEPRLDPDSPLIILNSDQIIAWDPIGFGLAIAKANADGALATFTSSHPKWSYAAVDEHGLVSRVAEKDPISTKATVGLYYWRRAGDFFDCTRRMIAANKRVNGEFYIAPVYNEAIAQGKRIITFDVEQMHGLGTPEDLQTYLAKSDCHTVDVPAREGCR